MAGSWYPSISQPQGFGIWGRPSHTLHICLSQPQTVHSQEPSFESTGSSSPGIPRLACWHSQIPTHPLPWGRQRERETGSSTPQPPLSWWHLPPCQVCPFSPVLPVCVPTGWFGHQLGAGWAEQAPQGFVTLVPTPPERIKPNPGFLLEQQPGTAWPGLSRGPPARPRFPNPRLLRQGQIKGARSAGRCGQSPADTDQSPDGRLVPVKNQTPALVSGATTPSRFPRGAESPPPPGAPGQGGSSPAFVSASPRSFPGAVTGSAAQQAKGHTGHCPLRAGTPACPSDHSAGAADGTTKEQPRLHQPGGNPKPPRANSSPEFSRGHCSTKEPFSP